MRTVRIYEYKEKEVPRPHQNLQVTSHSFNIAPSEDISTDDIKKLEQLTIAPKYLYVDALNFGGRFFTRGGSHWTVVRAVNRIKKFIEAATNSGWQLKVFIDAATKSGEAMSKWRRRREAEVKKENREIPQGMNIIFGDAFRENGIEVFYSVEADNDDTLAAYASQDQAAILSGDKDFFRYRGLKCPLYGDFEIRKRRLYLYELKPNDKPIPKRNIISPPPTITDKDPSLVNLADNFYLRGAPSALVKRIGNIHITCRPLRQAVYSRRGVKTAVREIFPIWQEDRVFWLEEEVIPDPKLDHLLDNPTEALETFFPKLTLVKPDGVSNLDWENHLYAMHAVIFELCALGSKEGVSFLQMILSVAAKPTEKPQNQEKFQKRWEKKPPKASIPAYETICVVCESTVILFERDVLFFQSKGFDMPKRCKGCRQAKHKK